MRTTNGQHGWWWTRITYGKYYHPYMHILIFHVPNMIRMYGSLKKFSDQGTVAKFHYSGSAAWCIKKCCNTKGTYNAHTTEQYLTYNLLEQWWQTGGGKKISENFNGISCKRAKQWHPCSSTETSSWARRRGTKITQCCRTCWAPCEYS